MFSARMSGRDPQSKKIEGMDRVKSSPRKLEGWERLTSQR